MIKGLVIRLVSVSMFTGFVLAACSGKSGSGGPSDAGALSDGRGSERDGTTDDGAAGDGGADDGPIDGGAECVPSNTRCSGNAIQVCSASGQWGEAMDCGQQACVGGGCIGVCAPGSTQCS